METLINLALITIAILGALYALGLIIVALIGPPLFKDEADLYCTCDRCDK